MQCAVLVVRRAEVAQANVRLARDPLLQRSGETRLADARLARKQNNLTLAALGSLPAPEQQFDLLLAPDQRRLPPEGCSASKRFSTALSPKTRQARTGSAKPFTSTAPRSRIRRGRR